MPTEAVRIDDPNVKIPAAIAASAAKAQELHDQIYKKDEPKDPPKDPPKAETKDPTPADSKQPTADTSPKEPPADPVTQKGNDTSPPKEQNWEHAYKSMKGRYDQAMATVRSQNDRLTQLEQALAELRSAATIQPAPKTAEADPASLITPDEQREYGDEFLTVVGKKARQEVAGEVAMLRQQLADLQKKFGTVDQTIAKTDRERMKDALTQSIPNWNDINHDKAFHDWLALQDPLSGAIRHNLLKAAWDRNNTVRVMAFFKGFLAEQATGTPPSEQPDPAPSLTGGKVPLEQLAAPGRAKTAADTGSPAEKPILTRAQIASFYADKAAGKWRGREKQADEFEQQIFAAQNEGRIR